MEKTDCVHMNSANFQFIRFKKGEEQVFEHLFLTLYDPLVGFCIQFLNNDDDAKDIAQEAFVNLWLNRQKIENPAGIKAFLYTFAKSACFKSLRHKQVIEKYINSEWNKNKKQLQLESFGSFDFNSLEYVELNDLIQQSIGKLSEKCRMVFEKKRFEGKANKEIAEEMGITIKSVEANMTRALKSLKTSLKEYLPLLFVGIFFLK